MREPIIVYFRVSADTTLMRGLDILQLAPIGVMKLDEVRRDRSKACIVGNGPRSWLGSAGLFRLPSEFLAVRLVDTPRVQKGRGEHIAGAEEIRPGWHHCAAQSALCSR